MEAKEMKDKLLKIINHYGVNHQLRKFQEEVFELTEVIILQEEADYDYYEPIDDMPEEFADCLVLISQFVEYYKINQDDILKIMKQKVDRQLKRIEGEDKI